MINSILKVPGNVEFEICKLGTPTATTFVLGWTSKESEIFVFEISNNSKFVKSERLPIESMGVSEISTQRNVFGKASISIVFACISKAMRFVSFPNAEIFGMCWI